MPRTKLTPESIELGRRIRNARIAAGFTTQGTAAAQLGKPREFVQRIEVGRVVPGTPSLLRLILGLRLDPLDLFPEAAAWIGKPAALRWPEGHPNAALLANQRGRGRPPVPKGPTGRTWPAGYTITAEAIETGNGTTPDPDDTAIDDQVPGNVPG